MLESHVFLQGRFKVDFKQGDPDLILGYTGKGFALADALWAFAEAYADQTERDYGRFIAATHDGRLKVAELAPVAPVAAAPASPKKALKAKAKPANPTASRGAKR